MSPDVAEFVLRVLVSLANDLLLVIYQLDIVKVREGQRK